MNRLIRPGCVRPRWCTRSPPHSCQTSVWTNRKAQSNLRSSWWSFPGRWWCHLASSLFCPTQIPNLAKVKKKTSPANLRWPTRPRTIDSNYSSYSVYFFTGPLRLHWMLLMNVTIFMHELPLQPWLLNSTAFSIPILDAKIQISALEKLLGNFPSSYNLLISSIVKNQSLESGQPALNPRLRLMQPSQPPKI